MTTIDLYHKHKAGEISREKFLYEVRRNEQLPWITNLTSYDDAVKILKNKGVVTEAKIEEVFALTPAEESTLEKIVAKYIEDADAISKEMGAYYKNGFLGFSDMLQSNLKRDSEYTSWTQRTNDEEQFRSETGDMPGFEGTFDALNKIKINEDWGSSDQSAFNQSIHKDLGNPTEMPMPFDPDFEAAVADAVDFWWDDWDEYRKDRDGLIDEAKRRYLRSYFPEDFKMLTQMFSEALNEGKKDNKAKKETKTKTVDYVNPYEYHHGLTYELEQADDYSADGLEKAIDKVLKNLTKDITFYSTLLNQKQSSFEFKKTETDAKGMQANADGTLKKGAGKLEKANVKDNLGKKEAGKSNPKGVKTMPDKGVTGTQKIIKEEVDVNFEESNKTQFEDLMKKYDWYYEMSDDSAKYNAGKSIDKQLKVLGSKIGGNKAVEIFNKYAPADRKITSTFFSMNENEDKKAKLKELLKKALKEVDPQLQKLSKDEENAERSLADILQKKAAILNKPGTQG
jgi:exonuclease III